MSPLWGLPPWLPGTPAPAGMTVAQARTVRVPMLGNWVGQEVGTVWDEVRPRAAHDGRRDLLALLRTPVVRRGEHPAFAAAVRVLAAEAGLAVPEAEAW